MEGDWLIGALKSTTYRDPAAIQCPFDVTHQGMEHVDIALASKGLCALCNQPLSFASFAAPIRGSNCCKRSCNTPRPLLSRIFHRAGFNHFERIIPRRTTSQPAQDSRRDRLSQAEYRSEGDTGRVLRLIIHDLRVRTRGRRADSRPLIPMFLEVLRGHASRSGHGVIWRSYR